jgi:hypothetical protein
MTAFIARSKQRKLVQWALSYLAAAWVLLQVLGLAADSYDWPHGFMRIAFAAITLGFVVALVLAWYHGERGAQRVTGTELFVLTLLLAIGGGLPWRFGRTPSIARNPDVAQRNPGTTGPESAAINARPVPIPPGNWDGG